MKFLAPKLLAFVFPLVLQAAPIQLFDGKTLTGWECEADGVWRVEEGGIIAAGHLDQMNPRNEFLATTRDFKNFDFHCQFKVLGTEGFVNSGVQFRSVRIPKPPNEMSGYQADLGDPNFWGALYDESRRKKTLVEPDKKIAVEILKRNEWNEYRVRAEGAHIQIWLNGVQTVDYTEPDAAIPQEGKLALQIHGKGKTEVRFKDIMVEELP